MQCDEAQAKIGAYLDGETTATERRAIETHLETCAACRVLADDQMRLSRQIVAVGRQRAPKGLAIKVRTGLAAAARAGVASDTPALVASERRDAPRSVLPAPTAPQRGLAAIAGHGWMRRAAALIAVAALSSTLTFAVTRSMDANARLQDEVVSAHIRSLWADSPIQIASSDQHTVKPWFNGRIDFAPEVKDLAAEGFALAGGRLDYVGGRRVGSLVYKRRLHVVNVFMWPAATGEPAAPRSTASNGFNTVQWSRNGVVYWAISDLNAGELQQLPSLM